MSEKQQSYVWQQYYKLGLVDKNMSKMLSENDFDPNVYPDTGHIPVCSSCKEDYDKFKTSSETEVAWNHPKACLWYEYFILKVKAHSPTARIIRHRKKN